MMSSFHTLIIASHNAEKIKEIATLLAPFSLQIKCASDFSLNDPKETEQTFEGNALIKARYVFEQTGLPSLADDSGLVIPSLGGAPGIYSARWGGPNRDFNLAAEKIKKQLPPNHDPYAYFVCVLALVLPNKTTQTFEGRCEGHIQFPGKGYNGHGYDPIFVPKGYTQTFAEMDTIQKNTISHRAQAFEKLITFMSEQLMNSAQT